MSSPFKYRVTYMCKNCRTEHVAIGPDHWVLTGIQNLMDEGIITFKVEREDFAQSQDVDEYDKDLRMMGLTYEPEYAAWVDSILSSKK